MDEPVFSFLFWSSVSVDGIFFFVFCIFSEAKIARIPCSLLSWQTESGKNCGLRPFNTANSLTVCGYNGSQFGKNLWTLIYLFIYLCVLQILLHTSILISFLLFSNYAHYQKEIVFPFGFPYKTKPDSYYM